ncbi:anti-sigma factor [Pollutimonas sp. H1-120]|uniref:anti-sigma factor n=1 Tax=Pollutimonas sp. H1-120 TaxID=3148824 RepID=UPI003B52E0BE
MTRNDQGILIAEYTLGLLNPQEMAQAHALLGQDAEAVVQALDWERRFLELTDLLAPVDPSPLLLAKIQTSLGHDTTPRPSSLYRKPAHNPPGEPPPPNAHTTAPKKRKAQQATERIRSEPSLSAAPRADSPSEPDASDTPPATASAALPPPENTGSLTAMAAGPAGTSAVPAAPPPAADTVAAMAAPAAKTAAPARTAPRERISQGNIWIWRAASVVFAAIALALGLMPAKPVPPPVTVVELAPTQAAILQAPGQSSTPGWTVTIDPQQNVLLDPQVRSDIPADASVQLWTHNKNLPQPRSLGLIDPNKPVTVPAALMGQVSPDQIFEMTLEPAGGSPTAAPTGPILFIGRVVTFGKRPPPSPAAGASAPPAGSS